MFYGSGFDHLCVWWGVAVHSILSNFFIVSLAVVKSCAAMSWRPDRIVHVLIKHSMVHNLGTVAT